jgi:hypothetical protein
MEIFYREVILMEIFYQFTQQIDDTVLLTTTINNAGLSTPLDHITTVGSGATMNVCIAFKDVLSDADSATLTNLMANYTNTPSATIASMISKISTAIQTQSNLMIVLNAKVNATLPNLSYEQLQQIMTLLGIS